MLSEAVNPHVSATVFASAGTGKTWQLVTRLLRLLLNNVEPGAILAVTFTRKAAGEMQERLLERLQTWAIGSESELEAGLLEVGLKPTPELKQTARNLYEKVLLSPQPVRTTTFHAFCQDLLGRFPLEAGIAPGFELVEETTEQEEQAMQQLMVDADAAPQDELANALLTLLEQFSTISSVKGALQNFLSHRPDWWAWTEDSVAPIDLAKQYYADFFGLNLDQSLGTVLEPHCNDLTKQKFKRYAALLAQDPGNKTRLDIAATLASTLADNPAPEVFISGVHTAFKVASGKARSFKISGAFKKKLGTDDADTLEALHEELEQWYDDTEDLHRRYQALHMNLSWAQAGSCLLDHFQAIKRQRRQLDFNDLEWLAYRLLNHSANAELVQYKLDEKIDHLLVDEFQDTNPTQWQLILPLLTEFAAGERDRPRTVFLVGDTKQSIYGFRRANPALQTQAAEWMATQLVSHDISMDKSWRSANAIMTAANQLFLESRFKALLHDFQPHETHRNELWGRVEILPPQQGSADIEPQSQETENEGFRNPLTTSLIAKPDAHDAEAKQIADRIISLTNSSWEIGSGESAHAVDYDDIFILIHRRTHAPKIERALQAAGIPYAATTKGTLLERLEIKDIRALLSVLHSPQNNLALAQVLRSPIFDASDEHLISLARTTQGSWWDSLAMLGENDTVFATAIQQLTRWKQAAATLPLHDLLDQIYFEGNLLDRYTSAAPDWQKAQVKANLQRLLELALEVDSGRYPSVSRFEEKLHKLSTLGKSAPSEPAPGQHCGVVKILTIHESKGLEAPIVFLSNLDAAGQKDKSGSVYVNWPTRERKPTGILIRPGSKRLDSKTQQEIDAAEQKKEREAANLIYVAMTRARQILILTGAESGKDNLFLQLSEALDPLGSVDEEGVWSFTEGNIPIFAHPHASQTSSLGSLEVPAELQQKPTLAPRFNETSPSQSDGKSLPVSDGYDLKPELDSFEDGAIRGSAIHAFIEHLSDSSDHWPDNSLIFRVAADLNIDPDNPLIGAWFDEAKSTCATYPDFFQGNYLEAQNEVPIAYGHNGEQIFGIIDRLLVYPSKVMILDYKTHRITAEAASGLKAHYHAQMAAYATGIKKLYPEKDIACALLFTFPKLILNYD